MPNWLVGATMLSFRQTIKCIVIYSLPMKNIGSILADTSLMMRRVF